MYSTLKFLFMREDHLISSNEEYLMGRPIFCKIMHFFNSV